MLPCDHLKDHALIKKTLRGLENVFLLFEMTTESNLLWTSWDVCRLKASIDKKLLSCSVVHSVTADKPKDTQGDWNPFYWGQLTKRKMIDTCLSTDLWNMWICALTITNTMLSDGGTSMKGMTTACLEWESGAIPDWLDRTGKRITKGLPFELSIVIREKVKKFKFLAF